MYLTERMAQNALSADLPLASKVTLAVMCRYSDQQGYCYPSQATLADASKLSRRVIQRALADLRRRRYIDVIRQGNSAKSSTLYRLNLRLLTGDNPTPVENPNWRQSDAQLATIATSTGDNPTPQPDHEPDHEPYRQATGDFPTPVPDHPSWWDGKQWQPIEDS